MHDTGYDAFHVLVKPPRCSLDGFDEYIGSVDVAGRLSGKVVVKYNFVFIADTVHFGDGETFVGGVDDFRLESHVVDPHFFVLVEYDESYLLQFLYFVSSSGSVPAIRFSGYFSVHYTTAVRLSQQAVVHILS